MNYKVAWRATWKRWAGQVCYSFTAFVQYPFKDQVIAYRVQVGQVWVTIYTQ